MEAHIELELLECCFNVEWSNVYLVQEVVELRENHSVEVTKRTYVYWYDYRYYRVIWTREETIAEHLAPCDFMYWGDAEEIDVPEFEHLRFERDRIDTRKNKQHLKELRKKVARWRKKNALAKRPRCAKCGNRMVQEQADFGPHWRCLKWPKCKARLAIELVKTS